MQFWRKRTGDLAREFSIIGQINQLSLVCKWDILWGIFIQAECLPNAKAKSWNIKILLIWPWLPCFQAWFWVSVNPRQVHGQWPGTDWWFFGTEARNTQPSSSPRVQVSPRLCLQGAVIPSGQCLAVRGPVYQTRVLQGGVWEGNVRTLYIKFWSHPSCFLFVGWFWCVCIVWHIFESRSKLKFINN